MVAFLELCYNWGELRMLLIHYGVKLESATNLQLAALQEDISATNLAYLHPYLCSELWNLVAQRIGNFGESDCKELLVYFHITNCDYCVQTQVIYTHTVRKLSFHSAGYEE
jgi:hypothetical protein